MIFYLNGCSHSKHSDKLYNYSAGYYLSKYFNLDNISTMYYYPWIQPITFEKKIQKACDEKDNFVLNTANDGKSNDSIYFESISNILRLIENNCKPDFVTIQWSGPSRRLIMDFESNNELDTLNETNKDMFISYCTPHDHFDLNPHLEPLGSIQTLFFIYSMQEFLKKNKIKYLFYCYMELSDDIQNQFIFKMIDTTKFVTFDDNDKFYIGWLNKMKENPTAIIDKDGHPSIVGKKYITHRILKKLKDLYNVDYIDYNKSKKDFFKFL